jgi:aspartokinase-like uncharacterized kinase
VTGGIDAVVKVGGGLLRTTGALDAVTAAVAGAARRHRMAVVPGGGPFADAVRAVDAVVPLGDGPAHWMAVLAMDQYAHLLAARTAGARLTSSAAEVHTALDDGCVPVLAPFRWLRDADPLPHGWAVTSDSIAAWIAGALGARRLVLVKPAVGELADLVDEYFPRALPAHVRAAAVGVNDGANFARALEGALGR